MWAKKYWTQTAQLVDKAIASELHRRNAMRATIISEQEMNVQVKKVSAALNALHEQHKASQEAWRVQREQEKKAKWYEAERRRRKKQSDKADALRSSGPAAKDTDEAVFGRLQVALASYHQGGDEGVGSNHPANVQAVSISAFTKRRLMGPKFNFIHDVLMQLIAATQYLPEFFSVDESNRRSVCVRAL